MMGAAMGFMYNSVVREPLSFSVTRVSRKGICFASERSLRSQENFREGWKIFKRSRKVSRESGPCVQIQIHGCGGEHDAGVC